MMLDQIISQLNPTTVSIAIIIFALTYYISYTYISKDLNNEEIDYKIYIYSLIPSIIVTVLVVYGFNCYKPRNNELLKGDFYN